MVKYYDYYGCSIFVFVAGFVMSTIYDTLQAISRHSIFLLNHARLCNSYIPSGTTDAHVPIDS